MLAVLEPEVTIRVRQKDADGVAQEAAERAGKRYQEISGRSVKTNVDGSLSDDLYVYCFLQTICATVTDMCTNPD